MMSLTFGLFNQVSGLGLLGPLVFLLLFQNNSKNLDLSYKTDLDFMDHFLKRLKPCLVTEEMGR